MTGIITVFCIRVSSSPVHWDINTIVYNAAVSTSTTCVRTSGALEKRTTRDKGKSIVIGDLMQISLFVRGRPAKRAFAKNPSGARCTSLINA